MRTNPIDAVTNASAYVWEFWTDAPALSWVGVLLALVAGVVLWHADDCPGDEGALDPTIPTIIDHADERNRK